MGEYGDPMPAPACDLRPLSRGRKPQKVHTRKRRQSCNREPGLSFPSLGSTDHASSSPCSGLTQAPRSTVPDNSGDRADTAGKCGCLEISGDRKRSLTDYTARSAPAEIRFRLRLQPRAASHRPNPRQWFFAPLPEFINSYGDKDINIYLQ